MREKVGGLQQRMLGGEGGGRMMWTSEDGGKDGLLHTFINGRM